MPPKDKPMAELSFLTPKFSHPRFPTPQIMGYAVSLVLTLLALWLGWNRVLPAEPLVVALLILAVLQAVSQLVVFMHIWEAYQTAWNALAILLGLLIGVGMVITTVWIMAFKTGVS